MKKTKIPKGKVAIEVTVKVIDPSYPKKDYKVIENRLTKEAVAYLKIFLDPKINEELFK